MISASHSACHWLWPTPPGRPGTHRPRFEAVRSWPSRQQPRQRSRIADDLRQEFRILTHLCSRIQANTQGNVHRLMETFEELFLKTFEDSRKCLMKRSRTLGNVRGYQGMFLENVQGFEEMFMNAIKCSRKRWRISGNVDSQKCLRTQCEQCWSMRNVRGFVDMLEEMFEDSWERSRTQGSDGW